MMNKASVYASCQTKKGSCQSAIPCFIRVHKKYTNVVDIFFVNLPKKEAVKVPLCQYIQYLRRICQLLSEVIIIKCQLPSEVIILRFVNTHLTFDITNKVEVDIVDKKNSFLKLSCQVILTSIYKGLASKTKLTGRHCIYTYTGTPLWGVSCKMYLHCSCLGGVSKTNSKTNYLTQNNGDCYV